MTRRTERVGKIFALVGVWLVSAVAFALIGFANDSRTVVIGAHTTSVQPTFDGYATLDFGPVLPRFRVDAEVPFALGVRIDVGDTEVTNVNEVIRRDALIASQPDGEIRQLRRALTEMAIDQAIRGAGAGTLATLAVAGLWRLVGPRRRADVWAAAQRLLHERRRRPLLVAGGIVLAIGLAGTLVVVPKPGLSGTSNPDASPMSGNWVPLPRLFPDLSLNPELNRIEVLSGGGATRGGVELIRNAVESYNESQDYYQDLTERAAEIGDQLRDPAEDETVALLVADRHDNIGMDPVARAVADAGGATMLLNAGDDTSSGGSWEAFSVNSLADAFEGFEIVVVGGNHDYGGAIADEYEEEGFTVLAGEPVTVEGITFLGDSDVRASGLGAGRITFDETVNEQAARLADVACDSGEVSTVLVHSPNAGDDAAKSGCVDLVLSGHVHRQIGPTTTTVDGRPVTTYSNGTTGGAAYALALGSALRRTAEVTLITYRDGRPVGLQPVKFATDGQITVGDWQPIAAGLDGDAAGPAGDRRASRQGPGRQDSGGQGQGRQDSARQGPPRQSGNGR